MESSLRQDDLLYIEYLTRGLDSTLASETSEAICRSMHSNHSVLTPNPLYSAELQLLIDLVNGDMDASHDEQSAEYLCAFGAGENQVTDRATWDAEFALWYEAYCQTECAQYRDFTKSLLHNLTQETGPKFRILDLGCGDASLLRQSLPADCSNIEVVGVEAEDSSRRAAQRTFPSATFYSGRIEEAFQDHSFLGLCANCNVVLASMVLHHLDRDDKQRVLEIIPGLLAPEGVLILNELYGGFEGPAKSTFRFLYNVVKYYGLESRMIYDGFRAQGKSPREATELLKRFFGREIHKLLAKEHVSGEERCIYVEEWLNLLRAHSLSPQMYLLKEVAAARPGAYEVMPDHLVTCRFVHQSFMGNIPLLYSIVARKV